MRNSKGQFIKGTGEGFQKGHPCYSYNLAEWAKTHSPWNKELTGEKSHSFRRKFSEERIEKISQKLMGNKNKLGHCKAKLKKSEKKHLDSQYKEWMLAVKRRDNWKCKIADINCKGRLESHHILNWINYPELRYAINNGITLCHAHHPRGRKREAKLSPYLQQLVAEMK